MTNDSAKFLWLLSKHAQIPHVSNFSWTQTFCDLTFHRSPFFLPDEAETHSNKARNQTRCKMNFSSSLHSTPNPTLSICRSEAKVSCMNMHGKIFYINPRSPFCVLHSPRLFHLRKRQKFSILHTQSLFKKFSPEELHKNLSQELELHYYSRKLSEMKKTNETENKVLRH